MVSGFYYAIPLTFYYAYEGVQWPTWRVIAKVKQRSSKLVIGWVIKIYYLELFRASEGSLSRRFWLHLQPLATKPNQKK
jgi:hypothetical protein